MEKWFTSSAGWTVVAGKIDKPPDVDRAKLLLVGACTSKFKKQGVFVKGCPPNNIDVTRGIGIEVPAGVDLYALG